MLEHEIENLIAIYLEGEITEAQAVDFLAWLRESPENAKRVARLGLLERGVNQYLLAQKSSDLFAELLRMEDDAEVEIVDLAGRIERQQKDSQERALRNAGQQDHMDSHGQAGYRLGMDVGTSNEGPRVIVIPRMVFWGSLVALIVLGFWIGYAIDQRHQPTFPVVLGQPGDLQEPSELLPDVTKKPDSAATYVESHHAVWWGPSPVIGQRVNSDEINLLSGLAYFEMDNGVRFLVEGPARLRIDGVNQVVLDRGRLTADVPESGHGFTVLAPSATIVDYGTAFGVEVDQYYATVAAVFEGEVRLSPTANGIPTSEPASLLASQSVAVSQTGQGVQVLEKFDAERFVEVATFDALQGELGSDSYADAVRKLRKRDKQLIAAHGFQADALDMGLGFSDVSAIGRYTFGAKSLSVTDKPGIVDIPGRLLLVSYDDNVDEKSSVYFDLDLTDAGRAATAGLIREDSRTLGKDGTRICLSWITSLESESDVATRAWAGLSLLASNADRESDEYMFVGRPSQLPAWGISMHRNGPDGYALNPPVVRPVVQGPEGNVTPNTPVRWLVVVDCFDGADQIAIYMNPDPTNLGEPVVRLGDMDIRFDQLRFQAFDGDLRWSLDELRIGTSVETVLSTH